MIDTANYDNIFSIISSIQNNDKKEDLIIKILDFASNLANADGYFFYNITSTKYINLERVKINSLHMNISGSSCDKIRHPIFIPDIKNKSKKKPLELCTISNEIINSPNIYSESVLDSSFFQKFDLINDYNTVSLLSFPLFNSAGNIISIINFINAKSPSGKIITFSQELQEKIISICQLISVLLERQQQSELYNKFLKSFVSTLSKIMHFKTPHIASHNKHVAYIAQQMAIILSSSTDNTFKNFEITDSEWDILNLASWLYDCGKIMVSDYILNKKSRLETVYNRIHEIRQRFEILRRDAHIEYLQKRLNNSADKETLQAEFVEKVKKLNDDFEFIGKCNNSLLDLKKEDFLRLDKIAEQSFTRYFNRSIGLSPDELRDIDNKTAANAETEYLLQDRPEQTTNIYNKGELSNLKTKTGALNLNERKKIQEYALNTTDILSDFPFPNKYSDIHEIISTNEKILKNFKSAPNDNSKITIITKIITFASIFASLVSKETPFSKNKKLSEIMKTMQKMKNEGKIDTDLYNVFIQNDIYIDFAKEFLDTEQIDEINIEEII